MSSVNNPARRQTEQGMMTAKIYVLNCSVYCHVSNIYVMEKAPCVEYKQIAQV